jgi:aryl-alcohol dehydrogenase-like predicted oxidoreductase
MEQKIGIVGSMALAQGLLAGIYQKIEDIPAPQAHSRHFKQERGGSESRHYEAGAEEEIFVVIDLLRRIASESGHTMAEISLAWVLSKPFMTSTLAGSRNIKELENNIAACDLELSKDIITQIDEASLPVWKKLGNSPDYYENREKSRIY